MAHLQPQQVSQGQRSAGAFRNVFVADAKKLDAKKCASLAADVCKAIAAATEEAKGQLSGLGFVSRGAELDVTSSDAKDEAKVFLASFLDCLEACVRLSMVMRYAILVGRACTQLQQVDVTADIPDVIGPAVMEGVKAYDSLYGKTMHYFSQAVIIDGNQEAVGHSVRDILSSMGDITVSVHQMYESEEHVQSNVFDFRDVDAVCEKVDSLVREATCLPRLLFSEDLRDADLVKAGRDMTLLAIVQSYVSAYVQRVFSYGPNECGDNAALQKLTDLDGRLTKANYRATAVFNRVFTKLEGRVSRRQAEGPIFQSLSGMCDGRFIVAPPPV
jgi:hypothetical protein